MDKKDLFNELSEKHPMKEVVKHFPHAPGVYTYYNSQNEVLYVGKAKNLFKRVSSYFTNTHTKDIKTRQLVRQITSATFVVVETESDALLLENNLIKQHQPPFNILLKDGKSYPFICISKDRFPKVFHTRQLQVDERHEYYGPYTNFKTVFALMELIRKIFKVRSCDLNLHEKSIEAGKFSLCLDYHIKKCAGPCVGYQSREEYLTTIQQIREILSGKVGIVKQYFKDRMLHAAEQFKFEEAQYCKETLESLDEYQSKSVITNPNISDTDVFAIYSDDKQAFISYIQIENGAVVRAMNRQYKKLVEESDEDLLSAVILLIREEVGSKSKRILTHLELDFPIKGVEFLYPKQGDNKQLVQLCIKNTLLHRAEYLKKMDEVRNRTTKVSVVEHLQRDLNLKSPPVYMECFDNSNLHGSNPVSSMVCFKEGKPSKSDYRKFKIKTVEGINDFASMYEVVYRRYSRLKDENAAFPDLVIIDGGKGQLSHAVQALKDLDLYGKMAIIGLAKRLEEVFFPEDTYPHFLDKRSPSLKVLQQIRNEAHRFAISFHRDLRSKAQVGVRLQEVPGIGPKTVQLLLKTYKSIKGISEVSIEDLTKLLGKKKAEIVYEAVQGMMGTRLEEEEKESS